MASRSRLGKGLGALFPDLPHPNDTSNNLNNSDINSDSEHNEREQRAQTDGSERSLEIQPELMDSRHDDEPSKRNGSSASSSTSNVSRETSPGSSESDALGTRSRTKSVKSSHRHSATGSLEDYTEGIRSVKASRTRRSSVPHLDELSHPSDLFFGETLQGDANRQHREANAENKAIHRIDADGKIDDVSRETSKNGSSQSSKQSAHDGLSAHQTSDKARQPKNAENPDSSQTEDLQPVKGAYLTSLKVDEISPNAHQPRNIFDEDELVELSHSIQEVGVLQPIVVRKRTAQEVQTDKQQPYELIMGERRWRASKLAKIAEIPTIVKTTPDDEMLRDALLENLHRVALNPLEEAAAYQQMIQDFRLTQEQLSQSISKSRPQIANMLRLLQLPSIVQKKVASGVLSAGHARALLALSDTAAMEALANRIIAEGLSVRSTEEIVAMAIHRPDHRKPGRHSTANIWADSDVRNSLEDRFETKVSIKGSEKKGKIEIVFSSPEDMQRIVDMLLPNAQKSQPTHDEWV
ncbi:ParB/RepB/Spo0J family partition protein [Bifidobacterium aquikefiricola]|uniref:ParB/RepB/Spo0J family partition protein n=1 Tax=Bifidobacterium aquikefiricola TaxID=3059038 RepID=A0AB39U725_9BIFI